ncbi:hypothetical protein JHS3_25190 [Jeongeupia sp. HS-3]|nr:hypothetical protein JHS3_25190 [Jeongeupia sp. HS-3]
MAGIAADWIGVGVRKPLSRAAWAIAGDKPSEAKGMDRLWAGESVRAGKAPGVAVVGQLYAVTRGGAGCRDGRSVVFADRDPGKNGQQMKCFLSWRGPPWAS